MPRITLDKVTKYFGSVQVLPPIDLVFEDGEFTVLVGPSGCGKSTTLRILAGLETMSGGEIHFDDRPIGRLEPKQRDIAMVFQDYALYPHMNVARNMSFALRLARVPKSEVTARVQRVAEMLNIAHLLDRKPAELSGGQRQRVAMGRALVRDASTFLFDEPLSNLDAKLRAQMRAELASMRDTLDKNMVYVTHDQIEAMTLGDRIVVMNGGVVQQQGTPEQLFKKPCNKFVAGFIGSPAMNFIDGELSTTASAVTVSGAGFSFPLGAEAAARLSAAPTALVTVGIRPSSITLDVVNASSSIELRVVVAEYLGAQTTLLTELQSGERMVVEVPSTTRLRSGEVTTFGVAVDEVLIFDRLTGIAI